MICHRSALSCSTTRHLLTHTEPFIDRVPCYCSSFSVNGILNWCLAVFSTKQSHQPSLLSLCHLPENDTLKGNFLSVYTGLNQKETKRHQINSAQIDYDCGHRTSELFLPINFLKLTPKTEFQGDIYRLNSLCKTLIITLGLCMYPSILTYPSPQWCSLLSFPRFSHLRSWEGTSKPKEICNPSSEFWNYPSTFFQICRSRKLRKSLKSFLMGCLSHNVYSFGTKDERP